MSRCGRCKGRGYIQAIRGVGTLECPGCGGDGVKIQRSSLGARAVSVSLPSGSRCKVCGEPAVHSHHVIPQQRINRFVPADRCQDAKGDVRNTVPVCFGCHDTIEKGNLQLAPHELHPDFWEFVAEHDLYAGLPRYMAEAA